MARVFYLGGGTHARGMLRAIVPLDQLDSLVSPDLVMHIGNDFPQVSDAPLAVLEVSDEESTTVWPAGFWRVTEPPTEFDERLRFLPELKKAPERTTHNARRNGSALIHWLTRDMRSGA